MVNNKNINLKLLIICLSFFVIFIISCREDIPAPVIKSVSVRLDDRSQIPFSNTTASAFRSFFVELENADEWKNVKNLQILDPDGRYWEYNENELESYWYDDYGRFEFWSCYSSKYPHRVKLGKYTIRIKSLSDESYDYSFVVYGRGDPGKDTGLIYTFRGVSEPKILRLPSKSSLEKTSNYLIAHFNTHDKLISEVYLWFYDKNLEYLACSPKLSQYGDINTEGSNTIEIPLDALEDCKIDKAERGVIGLYSRKTNKKNRTFYMSFSEKVQIKDSVRNDIVPGSNNKKIFIRDNNDSRQCLPAINQIPKPSEN